MKKFNTILSISAIVAGLFFGGCDEGTMSDTTSSGGTSVNPLDTNFNSSGFVSLDDISGSNPNGIDQFSAITLDSSHSVYATGYVTTSANDDMFIVKYKSDGTLDTSFNSTGIVTLDNIAGGSLSDAGNSIAIDSSGNIYVTGNSQDSTPKHNMFIVKYKPDGTLDTTFNSTGKVTMSGIAGAASGDFGYSIAIDSSDNIYVTGLSSNGTDNDMFIVKYKPDGTLDTTFNSTGKVVLDINGWDEGKYIAIDSNNNIYVAGRSNVSVNNNIFIAKYDSSGALVNTFGTSGTLVLDDPTGTGKNSDDVRSLSIDSSGNLYIAGSSNDGSSYNIYLLKYSSAGVLDTTFGNSGKVVTENAYTITASMDANDKIYTATINVSGGVFNGTVFTRYNANGSVDSSFGTNGQFTDTTNKGFPSQIAINGTKVVVGGSYNTSTNGGDLAIWMFK